MTTKPIINKIGRAWQRTVTFVAAMGLVFGLGAGVALAAANGAQIQSRSIKMSDSTASGGTITTGVGSGTNVSYRVSFTAATSYTLKGVVLDFCQGTGGTPGTPFIGDSNCPAPTGFTVGATPTIDTSSYTDNTTSTPVAYNALGTSGDWTASSLYSGQTFYMTNTTGVAITAGNAYSFLITGVTNPSDLGTFYGRLITYTDTTTPPSYTHGNPGTYQDYGGFALSTTQVIEVTAKVQETITFCVSGDTNPPTQTPPADCSSAVAPTFILGHGTNNTLDSSQVDTGTVFTLASTNALHGLDIRMHNSNACGGLSADAGTTCPIPAANAGAATPAGITAGTAAFGMSCQAVAGGTGTLGCDTNYNDGTATHYAMDTTSTENVTTTYGDQVAFSTAPISTKVNQYDFAATASITTPAGIYTANLSMIATGTF